MRKIATAELWTHQTRETIACFYQRSFSERNLFTFNDAFEGYAYQYIVATESLRSGVVLLQMHIERMIAETKCERYKIVTSCPDMVWTRCVAMVDGGSSCSTLARHHELVNQLSRRMNINPDALLPLPNTFQTLWHTYYQQLHA